jgi:hypothetical protein
MLRSSIGHTSYVLDAGTGFMTGVIFILYVHMDIGNGSEFKGPAGFNL